MIFSSPMASPSGANNDGVAVDKGGGWVGGGGVVTTGGGGGGVEAPWLKSRVSTGV